ncbi:hypothetical protein SALWKB12_1910 [Snodgrassella communis]|uniref:Uncharacterized protein n=1 Tax=Snodgrassella communis TaxID=2946699 RepID=A0A837AGB9_9NEIS|nr:hypothetical protein SALWKB12_1910 [Snodgrassella communis]KDN14276.1 hypothetical protein SALWKB29_1766 [Snodgrassella communis]
MPLSPLVAGFGFTTGVGVAGVIGLLSLLLVVVTLVGTKGCISFSSGAALGLVLSLPEVSAIAGAEAVFMFSLSEAAVTAGLGTNTGDWVVLFAPAAPVGVSTSKLVWEA